MTASPASSSIRPRLLAIVEQGGYPNFLPLYESTGYDAVLTNSVRKALALIKQARPDVVVAEFNFQTDFRDRTSSLDTLLATLKPLKHVKAIVFYDKEFKPRLDMLLAHTPVFETLPFPIGQDVLRAALQRALPTGA